MTPVKTLTVAARLEMLESRMLRMEEDAKSAKESADEMYAMVKALSDALLKPQPGHEKSLLDRIAAVTIKVERGEWSIRILIFLAAMLPTGFLASWSIGVYK
jgi:hypothetical protein